METVKRVDKCSKNILQNVDVCSNLNSSNATIMYSIIKFSEMEDGIKNCLLAYAEQGVRPRAETPRHNRRPRIRKEEPSPRPEKEET